MSQTSSTQSTSPRAVSAGNTSAAKGLGPKQKTSHRDLAALLPLSQRQHDRVDLAPQGRLVRVAPHVMIPAPSQPQRASSGNSTPSTALAQLHLASSDNRTPVADSATLTLNQVMTTVENHGAEHIARWARPALQNKSVEKLPAEELVPSTLSENLRAHLVAQIDAGNTTATALVRCVPNVVDHFLARQFIDASTSLPALRARRIELPHCSDDTRHLAKEMIAHLSKLKVIPADFNDALKDSLHLAMAAHICTDTFNAFNGDKSLYDDKLFLQGLGSLFWHFVVTDKVLAPRVQQGLSDVRFACNRPETKRARTHL